jgi:hypothetical protein
MYIRPYNVIVEGKRTSYFYRSNVQTSIGAMVYAAVPTEMNILPIKEDAQIDAPLDEAGPALVADLSVLEHGPGFRRLYWGRHVEEPGQLHLHIGERRNQPPLGSPLQPSKKIISPLSVPVRVSLHQHYAPAWAP